MRPMPMEKPAPPQKTFFQAEGAVPTPRLAHAARTYPKE